MSQKLVDFHFLDLPATKQSLAPAHVHGSQHLIQVKKMIGRRDFFKVTAAGNSGLLLNNKKLKGTPLLRRKPATGGIQGLDLFFAHDAVSILPAPPFSYPVLASGH